MLTRRKAVEQTWLSGLASAAELPHEVQLRVLAVLLGSHPCFVELDRYRRVCKPWCSTIEGSEMYIGMLRAERLCAAERQAWGKHRSMSPSSRRLPPSLRLPFRNSDGVVDHVRFQVVKTYKRASLFVLRADSTHATPRQVVALLQTMCELEGAVCVMLFMVELPPSSPGEWVQEIKTGIAGGQTSRKGWDQLLD